MKQDMQQNISRRQALTRLTKLGFVAGALGPAALDSFAAGKKSDFKFIAVNDTHYMSEECGVYLSGLVKQMNAERPSFVLHLGDLTDNGEFAQCKAVRHIFKGLDCSRHFVPGNHDWLTPTDRKPYLDTFSKQLNYSFNHGGWQFVGLDTTEGQKYEKTNIQPETFAALDKILGHLKRDRPTVLFTHFPLCENVKMRPLNAEELLAKFKGWELRAVFNGHYHAFTECEREHTPITTNRCCALKRNNHDGTKEKGYFVCDVTDGKLNRRFVEYKGP